MSRFNNNLRTILIQRGLTQNQFAAKCCIRSNTINRYVTGRHQPEAYNAQKIADALGLTITDIWPTYNQDKARISSQKARNWNERRAAAERKRKELAEYAKYKKERHERSDMAVDNVVPLSLDLHASDFSLLGGIARIGDLEKPAWCLDKAQRLHRWLVEHCAWGVYRHLRQIMADENRLAENRRSTQ